MRNFKLITSGAALAVIAGAGLWMSGVAPITAADHLDPPQRSDPSVNANADLAADLADVYLYHTTTSLIVSFNFAGPRPPTEAARYDRDVLYNVLLSNAGSKIDPEFTFDVRFGQDRTNPAASGIRIAGLPGLTEPLVGPVESTITAPNGIKVYAGLVDDPFNLDAVGLRLTRESGSLMFSNQRNRFAQQNITAVVIEIPLALIRNGDNPITAWAHTARIIPA